MDITSEIKHCGAKLELLKYYNQLIIKYAIFFKKISGGLGGRAFITTREFYTNLYSTEQKYQNDLQGCGYNLNENLISGCFG